jgi:hypothetical protein
MTITTTKLEDFGSAFSMVEGIIQRAEDADCCGSLTLLRLADENGASGSDCQLSRLVPWKSGVRIENTDGPELCSLTVLFLPEVLSLRPDGYPLHGGPWKWSAASFGLRRTRPLSLAYQLIRSI